MAIGTRRRASPGSRPRRRALAGLVATAALAPALVGCGEELASAGAEQARASATPDSRSVGVEEGAGLVTVRSPKSVPSTVARITRAVEANPMLTLVATVDHAAAAREVGLSLRPTTVLLVGNPMAGTPLMQASQTTGIDLPQKLLVWQDARGRTMVSYNDPAYLAERHGIEGQEALLGMIAKALRGLATSAG